MFLALKGWQKRYLCSDENAGMGAVCFELTGDCKRFRQPSLHLHIKAKLPVTCQRCLDDMLFDLDLSFDYLISEFCYQ